MDRSFVRAWMLGIGILLGGATVARAQGYIPPPPTPTGFKVVEVSSAGAEAVWNPTPRNLVVFAMDSGAGAVTAPESDGHVFMAVPVNVSAPHRFTLVAQNWGGRSAPAVYLYTPPLSVRKVPFEVVDKTTAPVAGFVEITHGTNTTYSVAARASQSGVLQAGPNLTGPYYIVASVYRVTQPQRGYDEYNKCYITVAPVDHQFPVGEKIHVTDYRASGVLSCSIALGQ